MQVSSHEGYIGVLIVDDQRAVREGVARVIACAPLPLRCIVTAASASEALSSAALLRPEVVVLDVDLDGEDGLSLIPRFTHGAQVLVFTSHGDAATRARARQLGAQGFVEKGVSAAQLLQAFVQLLTPRSREDKAPAREGGTSLLAQGGSSDVRRRLDS